MVKHKKFHLGIKGLIQNGKGEILLLLKSADRSLKYGRKPDWDIPGGRIEERMSVKETLIKEIKEETGITKFRNRGFFYAVVSNYWFSDINCGLILFIYEIAPIGKFQVVINEENTDFGWFDKNRAAELLSVKYPKDFTERIKKLG